MSFIERFRIYLKPKTPHDLSSGNWERAEKEMLKEFDAWRMETRPKILSINFGRRTGNSLDAEESSHYVYMDVLVEQ